MRARPVFLGKKIRSHRLRVGLSQVALAQRLGVSASYLNLLENDRRPVTTTLLLGLARSLDVDLRVLAGDADAHLVSGLSEVFGDPLFEDHPLSSRDIRDFVDANPDVANAVMRLHQAYASARTSLETLDQRLVDQSDASAPDRVRLSTEQVSDFIQRQQNYFPALEAESARVWAEGKLDAEDLYAQLVRYLEKTHRATVRVLTVSEMGGAVRRYDPQRRELHLSEVLRRGSRNFQLATQIGLLECSATIDQLAADPKLTTDESRALARVALASYFAGAVLMPYDAFLRAAELERYDIELLGHRFRVGWEQTCHRLTTLRKPGAEGVAFYFLRVDIAGNISKRFGAAGIQFPRFSGLCTLWNVHAAFLQAGRVRVQLSRLPDGRTVLAVARTVQRHSGRYHAPEVLHAVGIGCGIDDARRLVYGDGLDLENVAAAVPIGVTCRLCERTQCKARAFPSLHEPLRIDANVRGISFFAPVSPA